MAATILDGRALAAERRGALALRVERVRARLGRPPGLGVVLVGDDAASQLYVRNKARAAEAVGLVSQVYRLPADVDQAGLHRVIAACNANRALDAFLVQLPLPAHLDASQALVRVAPHKDADGLHPENVGALYTGRTAPRPCTPQGIMALLAAAGVQLAGAEAVVVGRSAIVGRPTAELLSAAHATVTLCHAQTRALATHVARAEVLVVAAGRPGLVPGAWIRPGAVVVDVGISRVALPNGGHALRGDVDFPSAAQRAAAITPVPGGVGPMTIAMLLDNAVAAAERADLDTGDTRDLRNTADESPL